MTAPNARQVTEFCRRQAENLTSALKEGRTADVALILSDVIEMAVATAAVRVDRRREDQTGTRAAIEEDIRREAFREGRTAALTVVIAELSRKGFVAVAELVRQLRDELAKVQR